MGFYVLFNEVRVSLSLEGEGFKDIVVNLELLLFAEELNAEQRGQNILSQNGDPIIGRLHRSNQKVA